MSEMQSLFDQISLAQKGDETALLELIDQFQPLLRKYSRKLKEEDAYSDLQLQLIEVIKKVKLENLASRQDPYLLNYIKKCMEHHFIKLSKKQNNMAKVIPLSAFGQANGEERSAYFLDKLQSVSDEYLQIEYDTLSRLLTPREAEIIIFFYRFHYPVKEIAEHCHVSMSAISQTKTNAVKKLKKQLLAGNF